MANPVSTNTVVFGDHLGNVAFLTLPEGVTPPPSIHVGDGRLALPAHLVELIYLGDSPSMFTRVLNHFYYQHKAAPMVDGDLRKQRAHPQAALAELLGVKQQYVSDWATGRRAPKLSMDQWGLLVRLVFEASAAA